MRRLEGEAGTRVARRWRRPSARLIRAALTSAIAVAFAAAGGGTGGCTTFTQDINEMSKGLSAPTPRQAAEWMFDEHDSDLRREGTVLISNAPFGGSDPYVRKYRDLVKEDHDPGVKGAAIQALARWGPAQDATLIASKLTDESPHVRRDAAKGLQRLHEPSVVPQVLQVIRNEEEEEDVRVPAAVALGQYKEDRVFHALVQALDARELSVNLAAAGSLTTLTGQTLGLDPRDWLKWYAQTNEPFSHAGEYLYPTYSRPKSFLETLAFWSSVTFEQPGVPTGMRPTTEKSTYGESEDQRRQ